MSSPVFNSLIPVVLLIFVGYLAGRLRWIAGTSIRDLSNVVFLVLAPALLFRTMSRVHLSQLDFYPVAIYFAAMWVVFGCVMLRLGFNRRAAVMGLAATFSNTLMIGVPLVSLAYGDAGLVTLFALISVHAFIMLTMVTVVLEFVVAREQARALAAQGRRETPLARMRGMALSVFKAAKGSVLHPVPLPIICGLLYGLTGWGLPEVIDRPLQLLGSSFSALALVLVGITLAANPIGSQVKPALLLVLAKNLLHPLVFVLIGLLAGLSGMPFAVMVLTASLPIGANVYLYSLRYQVAEQEVTAAVALSTICGLGSMAVVMALVHWLP